MIAVVSTAYCTNLNSLSLNFKPLKDLLILLYHSKIYLISMSVVRYSVLAQGDKVTALQSDKHTAGSGFAKRIRNYVVCICNNVY